MFDLALLIHISVPHGHAQNFFLGGIIGVIACKNSCLCIVDFDNLSGNTIQKITVMGYDQNSTLIAPEVCLQPAD